MARGRNPRGNMIGASAPAQPHARDLARGLHAALAADPAASAAARALAAHGEVFIVGGAVRDLLLGLNPKDVDLLVREIPGPRVERILRGLGGAVKMTGRDFGVFRYSSSGAEVEVALPRLERSTGDGHADFEVDFDPTLPLTDDLVRRDFTCNAIAFDLERGEIIDPHDGRSDIAAGVLRLVSDTAFAEDPLRILRGLRAHARHGLVPDEATRTLMATNAGRLAHLSAERIGEEWEKLLGSGAPAAGMALARETGVLPSLVTELGPGAEQAALRAEAALTRITTAASDVDLRAAAYLRELEREWAGLAGSYLERIVWPKKRAARISHLISCLETEPATDPVAARRLLARLGKHEAEGFLALRAGASTTAAPYARAEAAAVRQVIDAGHATSLRELAVDGSVLMAEGIPAGPGLGKALAHLLERVIEEPALNRPESLLGIARSL